LHFKTVVIAQLCKRKKIFVTYSDAIQIAAY